MAYHFPFAETTCLILLVHGCLGVLVRVSLCVRDTTPSGDIMIVRSPSRFAVFCFCALRPISIVSWFLYLSNLGQKLLTTVSSHTLSSNYSWPILHFSTPSVSLRSSIQDAQVHRAWRFRVARESNVPLSVVSTRTDAPPVSFLRCGPRLVLDSCQQLPDRRSSDNPEIWHLYRRIWHDHLLHWYHCPLHRGYTHVSCRWPGSG